MFEQHRRRAFRHTFIYADERKDMIEDMRRKAEIEAGSGSHEYRASRIKGFLTERKPKKRISSAAAFIIIVLLAVLWYFIVY